MVIMAMIITSAITADNSAIYVKYLYHFISIYYAAFSQLQLTSIQTLVVIYSTPVGFFLTRWHRSVHDVAAYRPTVDVSVFIHVTDGVCWVHKLVGSLDWSTLHRLATLGCVTTRPIEPQMAYETPAIELGRLRPNESSASVALR